LNITAEKLHKILLNEFDSEYGKILLHSKVKLLTAGMVLCRLREILLQIKTLVALFLCSYCAY
jgi:hypothetical protein